MTHNVNVIQWDDNYVIHKISRHDMIINIFILEVLWEMMHSNTINNYFVSFYGNMELSGAEMMEFKCNSCSISPFSSFDVQTRKYKIYNK
jgi:hypothetical protein